MLFVKIIVGILAVALIATPAIASWAWKNSKGYDWGILIPISVGVICISLDIALWGNFKVLFIISIILLAISIVGFIVAYVINKISVAKIKDKVVDFEVLTSETMESISSDLLYTANFSLSSSLGFIKYDKSKPAFSVDLKRLENMIIIERETAKGKLVDINNGIIEIMFENARKACTLYFKKFENGEDAEYFLCRENGSLILSDRKIRLDKEEYSIVSLSPVKYEELWEYHIQNFTDQKIASEVRDDIESCKVFGFEETIFYPPTLLYELD